MKKSRDPFGDSALFYLLDKYTHFVYNLDKSNDIKRSISSMPLIFKYEFYSEGFLGYSLEQDFHYWSPAHLLPIILLGLAIFLTFKYKDKIRSYKHEETVRFMIAALMIFNECFYYWRLLYVGNGGSAEPKQLLTYLPLQVCEWSAYLAAFMMMKKSRHIFDICFYVSLTLGLIPLFTPAVIMQAGPSYARYYQFWIEHLVPIYAVFYMMAVHGFRSSYKRVYKPFWHWACLQRLQLSQIII